MSCGASSNPAAGYVLVCRAGCFELRNTLDTLVLGAAVLVMSVILARAFGRLHGGL
jgi:ABC-type tungstate transport system substrate-binding protein